MYSTLSPDAIGVRGLPLADAARLARDAGFDGVSFDVREAASLVEERGPRHARDIFATAGVRPGYWNLPVAWLQEERWRADLADLPRLASVARGLGCPRAITWVPSGSDERPNEENFSWHVERFRPIAAALGDEGCRLGLEFIGPRTFRARFRHEFVYTLDGMIGLAAAIGTGNVGVLLDSWHLYTSGGTLEDLDRLRADDVVVVHVNDAPAGVARDEQIDSVRTLPMETGVIDLPGFMGRLRAMGYDGPVTPEPFSRGLADLAATDPAAAARQAGKAMATLWQAAGLT
ncbi:MAG: hypothetical protein AVDCRST_MAG49-4667 [uncultured Thermomicrobiales bacterium]|uniref:Xylose isomerase-like TIM barrel domain-containing protein n=1 Tax=uncultured Thermomicrobiales bacterium TaxID=1645740 RepID=A0A6J4VQ14_9BACT|nr:MAG: hypothetical protein AVDCRST_MAG49-4667 [uncultured Thermomicrobiales bacterium]